MTALDPSPIDIQTHLYAAFLDASTADVALHIHGSWNAIYKLHRVVLIQAGFFRSLFTSGFSESSPRFASHRRGPDELDIIFDDPNITRAAFEICISRLYGGGPPLHISPSLIPSTIHPLTPYFPIRQDSVPVPPNHHPATPRFLLSLLATAVYLSIPSLASQAHANILRTIGPHTVLQYLDFALGKGLGSPSSSTPEPEAAIGLENVAQIVSDDQSILSDASSFHTTRQRDKDIADDFETLDLSHEGSSSTSSASSEFSVHSVPSTGEDAHDRKPSFHYGAVSDKIGEATACWLARWAGDIMRYEEGKMGVHELAPALSRKRALTLPSDTLREGISVGTNPDNFHIPAIWGRGGLSPKWVAALISADTLFVKGERERYEFARSVVELRRKAGIDNGEETIWTDMFSTGIYYSNMVRCLNLKSFPF